LHKDMKIVIGSDQVSVERPSDNKLHRSLHGTTRSVIANMINGVISRRQDILHRVPLRNHWPHKKAN